MIIRPIRCLSVFGTLGKKMTAKPVYGIFEGGGAKGIGHIAGLKAAEILNLEFIGVAGASAGALIAALSQ